MRQERLGAILIIISSSVPHTFQKKLIGSQRPQPVSLATKLLVRMSINCDHYSNKHRRTSGLTPLVYCLRPLMNLICMYQAIKTEV